MHCEIGSAGVTFYWMVFASLGDELPDFCGGAQGVACGEGSEGKGEDNDDNGDCVDVVGQEGSLDTTKHGVYHDPDGE